MNLPNQSLVVSMKHIITSNHKEFLSSSVLFMSSNNCNSYSRINYKGSEYEIGNYITNIYEVCWYEILEIIVV